jgi:hypothetical protein
LVSVSFFSCLPDVAGCSLMFSKHSSQFLAEIALASFGWFDYHEDG